MEEGASSLVMKDFTRRTLFEIMQEFKGQKIDEKFSLMEEKLRHLTKHPLCEKSVISRSLRCFKSDFKKKWSAASYKEERFLKNNEKWLSTSIKLPCWFDDAQKPGRPTKSFRELSDRSKRRKTKDLRVLVPADELIYAAGVSQRAAGNTDASKIIKEITTTPTRATKVRKVLHDKLKQKPVQKHTPQEALAIFVEGDFTRKQWEVIHGANKSIYPCYSLIKKAKLECYPSEQSMRVTETCSEIELQALLDHTASRLYKYIAEVIEMCSQEEKVNLTLITKWGCDGSQQSQFKQKFQNSTDSDSNIFQSSLVPLRLVVQQKIIWQNPVPSSVRFCRPIRIRFVTESKDITKDEIQYVKNQIKHLTETKISTPNGLVKIKHVMRLTMVDGKVCNAATDTASTMRCYLCGQTSKKFNELVATEEVNEEALQFGLSILHARIRFFESLLHLSYKIPLKKWQARTAVEKQIVRETKERIQVQFKEELGLLVDIPKAGFGNTNDGNTSRRFFADPDTSARITGLNVDLIKKIRVILEVISSGHSINVEKFATYAYETAKIYVDLYGWHPMSPTIHKVLMHGAAVIKHAILPIGQLSEEAAEARNKNFRQYRINFARKFSRIESNKDILNRLLLSSDPYLSCSRKIQIKKKQPFSEDAIKLMVTPLPQSLPSHDESSTDDDQDEEFDSD